MPINIEALSKLLNTGEKATIEKLLASEEIISRINTAWLDDKIHKIGWRELYELGTGTTDRRSKDPATINKDHQGYNSVIFLNNKEGKRVAYLMGGVIGGGGKATIRHAYNLETGEHVALKVVTGVTDDKLLPDVEFKREEKALVFFERFYGKQRRENHQTGKKLYLAQEYIKGQSLYEYINQLRDKLIVCKDVEEAKGYYNTIIQVTGLVLKELSKFHQEGYIHRDIKPHNIMVIENLEKKTKTSPEIDRVVFVDFGGTDQIAEAMSREVGTEVYFAPELKEESGENVRFTQKTDVYATVQSIKELYELLASGSGMKKLVKGQYKQLYNETESLLEDMQRSMPRKTANEALAQFTKIIEKYTDIVGEETIKLLTSPDKKLLEKENELGRKQTGLELK